MASSPPYRYAAFCLESFPDFNRPGGQHPLNDCLCANRSICFLDGTRADRERINQLPGYAGVSIESEHSLLSKRSGERVVGNCDADNVLLLPAGLGAG